MENDHRSRIQRVAETEIFPWILDKRLARKDWQREMASRFPQREGEDFSPPPFTDWSTDRGVIVELSSRLADRLAEDFKRHEGQLFDEDDAGLVARFRMPAWEIYGELLTERLKQDDSGALLELEARIKQAVLVSGALKERGLIRASLATFPEMKEFVDSVFARFDRLERREILGELVAGLVEEITVYLLRKPPPLALEGGTPQAVSAKLSPAAALSASVENQSVRGEDAPAEVEESAAPPKVGRIWQSSFVPAALSMEVTFELVPQRMTNRMQWLRRRHEKPPQGEKNPGSLDDILRRIEARHGDERPSDAPAALTVWAPRPERELMRGESLERLVRGLIRLVKEGDLEWHHVLLLLLDLYEYGTQQEVAASLRAWKREAPDQQRIIIGTFLADWVGLSDRQAWALAKMLLRSMEKIGPDVHFRWVGSETREAFRRLCMEQRLVTDVRRSAWGPTMPELLPIRERDIKGELPGFVLRLAGYADTPRIGQLRVTAALMTRSKDQRRQYEPYADLWWVAIELDNRVLPCVWYPEGVWQLEDSLTGTEFGHLRAKFGLGHGLNSDQAAAEEYV